MIVERLQHFVRSLNDLTDGTPKKLVFFRIGGVSSSSRIEYEVKGNMVGFTDQVKEIDTQIIRYLRGALDVEVVPNKNPSTSAGMRVDIFMVIWKSMANITEDDAEQLFWGEPDVGIIRSAAAGKRVQQSIRSPFSDFLLEYYGAKPKPVQSLFVDHPEKDAESFYQNLLTLLAIGELECVLLGDELPAEILEPEEEPAEAAAEPEALPEPEELPATVLAPDEEEAQEQDEPEPEEIEELPATTLEAAAEAPMVEEAAPEETPEPEIPADTHVEQDDDDYIDSLINTRALEERMAKRKSHEKHEAKNGKAQDSLKLLFKDADSEDGTIHEAEGEELDLLSESSDSELPDHYLGNNDDDHDDTDKEDLNELLTDFENPFDAPMEKPKPTKKQQVKKIAGLQKILKATKKGF